VTLDARTDTFGVMPSGKAHARGVSARSGELVAYEDYKVAPTEQRRRQVEVEEIRRGIRKPPSRAT